MNNGLNSIVLRELGPADIEEFYRIRLHGLQYHSRSFWEAADEFTAKSKEEHQKRLVENFAAKDKFILGAFEDETLVGISGFYREQGIKGYHRGTVWGMYVHTDYQGKGIGGRLMDELIKRARAIDGLEVLFLFAAEAGVKLYESRGFITYGIEPYSLKDNDTYYDEAMMYLKL